MKKILTNIIGKFRQAKMKTQLVIMYFVAVFIPTLIVGIILITGNVNRLTRYHKDLLQSNNNRVRSVLYEITSQMYNISEKITFDDELVDLLSEEYPVEQAFTDAVSKYSTIEYEQQNYTGIENITIYTNQSGAADYKSFKKLTEDMEAENWYKKASNQYSVFWDTIETEDMYGNKYYNLALVRKITLYDTDAEAILVMKVSDNYLKSRIEDSNYLIMLSMEDKEIFYSSNRRDYGRNDLLDIIKGNDYFTYEGDMMYYNSTNLSCISTLNMTQSDSGIYVTTMSDSAYSSVQQIIIVTILIIAIALILPAFIMSFFIHNFSSQVSVLRDEMFKASKEDYNLLSEFFGCYELNAAYGDLKFMVDKIKEKDARMYANQIAEQKLLNEQQKMEFQMLASQINPHFLYNTLEMIRMKAITVGDRETATAIKLLGKSMRYVLDNTGIEYTTLAKELAHIETYLQIQRLRFGDRVNYTLEIEEGLKPDKIKILPLLLQPIVENAILHGLEEVESGGQITVYIRKINFKKIQIDVSDNGCGMDSETLRNMRENLEKGHINKRYGIGLYNINQRVRICYGLEYGVNIFSEEGKGTTVTTSIGYIHN